MSNLTPDRLSSEEILVLKFAGRRQLARWARTEQLSSHQQAQRTALARAVRILGNHVFAHGCELRVSPGEDHRKGIGA